jgi:glycosyltransferase involved in cell wall biosynthesis
VAADLKICLVSPEHSPWGEIGHSVRRLAKLLATHHEVTVIHSGAGGGDFAPPPIPGVREEIPDTGPLQSVAFSCESHQRSAAVLEAIERAYGSGGPDYLEIADYHGHGLVPLQARRAGHELLNETLIGVRLCGTVELVNLHDGSATVETRFASAMEREQFRLADRTIWRGGDTLNLYRRYYSNLEFPEAVRIRAPLEIPDGAPSTVPRDPGRPLRLLFVGRLQRVKGALDLAEACMSLPRDDWELTMIGADTQTAPLEESVRKTIEVASGDDPRIRFEEPLSHDELQCHWDSHDLLVVPSTFEVWPSVAIEAMRAELPILSTPVGGLAELVEPGATGWHSEGLGPAPLCRALTRLLEHRDEIERIRASGAIGERVRRLTDPEEVLASYERMLNGGTGSRPRVRAGADLTHVTVVIPYYRASTYVKEAVDSALAQTHPNLDVLIVNDGSFEPEDDVLERIASSPRVAVVTQTNRGETAARNLGVRLAGGEFVAMLDDDNLLEPEFVVRALATFRREPGLAYVTSWLSYIAADGSPMTGPSAYAPLGNSVLAEDTGNWDGDTLALLPRSLFSELGYGYETAATMQSDWELYRRLREDGKFGAVIPERLGRYRVRGGSITQSHSERIHTLGWEEARMRRALHSTRWVADA